MATEMAKPKQGQFGMMGLDVMGKNLALNVQDHGFPVTVWNRDPQRVDGFINENPGRQLLPSRSLQEFTHALERPRRIMMLIKAGAPVDAAIEAIKPFPVKADTRIRLRKFVSQD